MLHCCSLHCSQNVAKPAAAPVDDRTDNLCKGNLEIAKLQPCPTIKEHLTNEIGRWSWQDLVLPGPHHQRWVTAKRGYGPGRTMWSWQDQVLVPLTAVSVTTIAHNVDQVGLLSPHIAPLAPFLSPLSHCAFTRLPLPPPPPLPPLPFSPDPGGGRRGGCVTARRSYAGSPWSLTTDSRHPRRCRRSDGG